MPKELEFVGGKFPKPVKDALKERADAAGLSMNEYLERLFIKNLDKEPDGQFSEAEFKELMQKEVDAKVQAAMQKMPTATSFPKPVKDALKERADAAGLSIDDYVQQLIVESLDIEGDGQFSEEEYRALSQLDEKIQIAVEKAVQKSNDKEQEEAPKPKAVREQLSAIVAGELNCAIVDSYKESQELKEMMSEPATVIFFEKLADDLRERAENKATRPCDVEAYETVLPELLRGELDAVFLDAIEEVGAVRERFFLFVADLLNDEADKAFLNGRSFQMVFDRSEYFYLDNMLEYVNRQRKANSEEPFKDIQSWLRFKIGEQLLESAQPSFWGGYKYPEAAKLGESFQASSVGKIKE